MSLPSIHEMFPEHLMRPTPYTASPPAPQHELTVRHILDTASIPLLVADPPPSAFEYE
ncbi:hypothetical protein HDZ31DRAFT_70550 [Schizophyllum fasciatum]